MANVSYDTLTITINADSKNANASISKLNKNLNTLNETAKNLNTRRVGEIQGLLKNIAKIDFTNVSQGLKDIVMAFKYMTSKFGGKTMPLFTTPTTKKELDKTITSYTKLSGKLDFSMFGDVGKMSDQKVDEEVAKTTDEVKKLNKELDKTDKKGKKGGLQQLALQFKNILKYRVVRRIIQEIFTEISNAFGELANVDKDFDQAFGEIKSSFSYIARTLVSVIAPIIKAIAPIVLTIAEGLGSAFNSVGNLFAGALGQEEFAEAQENVESYTDSLKKAKSVSTGIDELNVIGNQSGSGNFEMKETSKTNNALADAIQKFIVALKPLFDALKVFIEKLQPLLSVIIDIISTILEDTMGDVIGSLISFIEMLGDLLHIVGLFLQLLKPFLTQIVRLGDQGLNGINSLMTILFNLIDVCLKPLLPILFLIGNILNLIAPILQGINEVIQASMGNSDNTGARVVAGILSGGVSELIRWIKGGFATGGFPEDGIFMANHNELVGQFSDGRTAVANNQQITQGIYTAVLQAMKDSGGNNVSIELDGYEVARLITKRQNNFGANLVMGGNMNYGK